MKEKSLSFVEVQAASMYILKVFIFLLEEYKHGSVGKDGDEVFDYAAW